MGYFSVSGAISCRSVKFSLKSLTQTWSNWQMLDIRNFTLKKVKGGIFNSPENNRTS